MTEARECDLFATRYGRERNPYLQRVDYFMNIRCPSPLILPTTRAYYSRYNSFPPRFNRLPILPLPLDSRHSVSSLLQFPFDLLCELFQFVHIRLLRRPSNHQSFLI